MTFRSGVRPSELAQPQDHSLSPHLPTTGNFGSNRRRCPAGSVNRHRARRVADTMTGVRCTRGTNFFATGLGEMVDRVHGDLSLAAAQCTVSKGAQLPTWPTRPSASATRKLPPVLRTAE